MEKKNLKERPGIHFSVSKNANLVSEIRKSDRNKEKNDHHMLKFHLFYISFGFHNDLKTMISFPWSLNNLLILVKHKQKNNNLSLYSYASIYPFSSPQFCSSHLSSWIYSGAPISYFFVIQRNKEECSISSSETALLSLCSAFGD